MEQRIRDRFNNGILAEAMSRYDIDRQRLRLLDGFESFIYEFEREERAYILRIGHTIRRSAIMVRAEIDWINYLAGGGASVARAIPSSTGQLVEAIADGLGGQFLATAFVKARGQPPWELGWTTRLYVSYGQLLGRMHRLSKSYRPADPAWQRPHWDDPIMLEVEAYLPPQDAPIVARFRQLLDHLQALPRDHDSYGLIHQDAHGANLFVDDDGVLTLFDFDDCTYSWYGNDLAIVLFYMLEGRDDGTEFTPEFLGHFLRGYRTENSLEARWLVEFPHFLKLREIDLYAVIHRSFDVDNIDDPWVARFMNGRRQRLLADQPYVEFDFETLVDHL